MKIEFLEPIERAPVTITGISQAHVDRDLTSNGSLEFTFLVEIAGQPNEMFAAGAIAMFGWDVDDLMAEVDDRMAALRAQNRMA